MIKSVIAACGIEIRRAGPVHPDPSRGSARDILLSADFRLSRPVVIDIPLARCRQGVGIAVDSVSHPYTAAVRYDMHRMYGESVLKDFYATVLPKSGADVLAVAVADAPGFADVPPAMFVMPWRSVSPIEALSIRAVAVQEDGRDHGVSLTLARDGYHYFGPVSDTMGELHLQRLKRIYSSMTKHGYRRSDRKGGDVCGLLLTRHDGDWACLLIQDGQHRAAVASALGHPTIPIRFCLSPILRENVDYWPQVTAGRITRKGALAIFDRVLGGEPPPDLAWKPK